MRGIGDKFWRPRTTVIEPGVQKKAWRPLLSFTLELAISAALFVCLTTIAVLLDLYVQLIEQLVAVPQFSVWLGEASTRIKVHSAPALHVSAPVLLTVKGLKVCVLFLETAATAIYISNMLIRFVRRLQWF